MNRHSKIKNLLATVWLALLAPAYAATNPPAHTYPNSLEMAVKIGNDLYTTLDAKFQKALNPEAISVEQSEAPFIAPIQGNRPGCLCRISLSTGFIDLINHIAHAKAIDRIQPGYFSQYVSNLAQQSPSKNLAAPPNLEDGRYWTDDLMAEQASFFNQMIGITMALNLSHHYLAHYNKYAAQMPDGKPVPINNFIAPREWEASVKYATLNSLNCALTTEGAKALLEFIGQMPQRPAWAGYIVPEGVNIKKLTAQLSQYQHDYYSGGLKLGSLPLALSMASK